MKDTYLITGITGQAGSYLADILLADGSSRVVGVRRRTSQNNTDLIKQHLYNSDFELVDGDITDPQSVDSIIKEYKPNYVLNAAAQSQVGTSFKEPGHTMHATGLSVQYILNSILSYAPEARFVQFSSSEMFGSQYSCSGMIKNERGVLTANKYQDEKTPMVPNSPYGIAKLVGYHYTRLYREAYGLFASNVIMFNYESPRRGEYFVTQKIARYVRDFSGWLNGNTNFVSDKDYIYHHSFSSNRFPKLRLGNLDSKRDWGYAKDYMEAILMVANHSKPDDFVVCTGETHSIRDFLDAAFEVVGIYDWSNFVVQDPKFMRPREVEFLRGDATKIKDTLQWTPKTSFKELVGMMVNG